MFGRQKKAIVSALHLPEDVVLGEMLLYFTGSRAAVVENYRSILFFSDEMLRLTGKNTRLTIKGKGLSIGNELPTAPLRDVLFVVAEA